MEESENVSKLRELLDQRTMALMERESDLADRMEEIDAQKEELTAAIEELEDKNNKLLGTLAELKERNYELDQILYRASHDLRSPIASINGVLSILKLETLNETQQICVDHIQDQSHQMDELLKALSTLAKAITNDLHFCKFDVAELIKSCISDIRFTPNFHSIDFQFHFNATKEIFSDQLLVSIVIKNILSNAITFRQPLVHGSIVIETKPSAADFEILITDDGEGIAKDIQAEIFKMFYRGSERSNGSGLGLYIVHKIVEQLKGSIDFVSENGRTSFKIKLPNTII